MNLLLSAWSRSEPMVSCSLLDLVLHHALYALPDLLDRRHIVVLEFRQRHDDVVARYPDDRRLEMKHGMLGDCCGDLRPQSAGLGRFMDDHDPSRLFRRLEHGLFVKGG